MRREIPRQTPRLHSRPGPACRRIGPLLAGLALALIPIPSAAEVEVEAVLPDVRVVGWTIDDTAGGNGDGDLDPGESFTLQIRLTNQGGAAASSVFGVLKEATDHPDVAVPGKVGSWPDVLATGAVVTSNAPHFQINVAPTRPCGWRIPLRLDLSAANGYFTSIEFSLEVSNPRVIDLDNGPGKRTGPRARPLFFGQEVNDHLGGPLNTFQSTRPLATGDLDGDGYDDLILGSPDADGPSDTRNLAGEVAILYGGPAPRSDTPLLGTLPDSAHIWGADAGDQLGSYVATGDLDGDGYKDIVLGVPEADGFFNNLSGAGEIAVVYGGPSRLADMDLASIPPGTISRYLGDAASEAVGALFAVGNLNGDPYDDLLVRLPGETAVLYGNGSRGFVLELDDVLSVNERRITGGNTSRAVADVDGDGYDDAILTFDSTAAVVYGGPGMLPSFDLAAPTTDVTFIRHSMPFSAVTAADVDGDGLDEVVVTAYEGAGPAGDRVPRAGSVHVVYVGSGRPPEVNVEGATADVATIYGAGGNDWLGNVLDRGDLDGDGYEDLVLPSHRANGPGESRSGAGEVAIIHGGPGRLPDIDLAASPLPANVTLIYGDFASDYLGTSVATGDTNGDGFDDLLIGAPGVDYLGGGDSGGVYVLPGGPRSRYRWDFDTFGFIDASAGTNLGLACDDCSVTIPIGFTFDFYGEKHDQVTVSSNGYLTFGGPGHLPFPLCSGSTNPPNGTIAVFWEDLNPATGGAVYSLLEGTAPYRRLTIQWDQVRLFPDVDDATFQVTLFESTDQILMQYLDVSFSGTPADFGGTAVVGIEDSRGRNGTPMNCSSGNVFDNDAVRFRRFGSPTLVYSDDMEGVSSWTADGLWFQNTEPTCTPSSRSGSQAWYWGTGFCDYDSFPLAGSVASPVIPALPQDSVMTFWSRRDAGADGSFIEARGSAFGPAWFTLATVTESSGSWLFSDDFQPTNPFFGWFAPVDLSGFAGQDTEVRFRFSAAAPNAFDAGWMVDDVEIHGCPVYDPMTGMSTAVAAEALTLTRTALYCQGQTGQVDALGSYCAACSPLSYQWRSNGTPIPGASGVSYDIPPSTPPGIYDFTVDISCASNAACAASSTGTTVEIVAPPAEIGPTLAVAPGALPGQVVFSWADVPGATDYVVRSDADPNGAFGTLLGTAPSGSPGLTIPTPPGDMVYFLVAGRNQVCGEGPR